MSADPRASDAAVRLARALRTLMADIELVSESDRPFRPFAAALPAHTPLTAETFRAAAGIGARYAVTSEPPEEFLRRGAEAEDPDEAAAYALLELVMRATLTDLQVFRVGRGQVVQVRVFLAGRLPTGDLAGLRSTAIET